MKILNKTKNGFALIEVVVYIALFSTLMGSAAICAYSLLESGGRTESKALLLQEGNFLLNKISFIVENTHTISTPSLNSSEISTDNTLAIVPFDISLGNPIVFSIQDNNLLIARGSASGYPLNNSFITLSNLLFTRTRDTSTSGSIPPESIHTSFTLTLQTRKGSTLSERFSETNYLHK